MICSDFLVPRKLRDPPFTECALGMSLWMSLYLNLVELYGKCRYKYIPYMDPIGNAMSSRQAVGDLSRRKETDSYKSELLFSRNYHYILESYTFWNTHHCHIIIWGTSLWLLAIQDDWMNDFQHILQSRFHHPMDNLCLKMGAYYLDLFVFQGDCFYVFFHPMGWILSPPSLDASGVREGESRNPLLLNM